MDEYNQAKEIFGMTLNAVKTGGQYPLDLKLQKMGSFDKIDDTAAQTKISEIESSFVVFKKTVADLLAAEVGSSNYRRAIQNVLRQSNQSNCLTINVTKD